MLEGKGHLVSRSADHRSKLIPYKMRVLSRLSHKYKRYNICFLKVTYAVMDVSP